MTTQVKNLTLHTSTNPQQPPTNHHLRQNQLKSQVLDIFNLLNSQINAMDSKIQGVINKHQGQFMFAYQNHLRTIKCQLQSLKRRLDEQEKIMNDNNRVVFLEKQCTLFRDEALKLYDRLEEKTQQAQFYKLKLKDLQKLVTIMQKQIKQSIKAKKITQIKSLDLQKQLSQIKQKLKVNQQLISKNTKPIKMMQTNTTNQQLFRLTNLNLKTDTNSNTERVALQSTKLSIGSKISNFQFKKKYVSIYSLGQQNQLKQWFSQCIKSVKKELIIRKKSLNAPNSSLTDIKSIQQFKKCDRLKIIQKFIQNQNLLVWMYQKIFPSRINQVKQYLSQRKINQPEEDANKLHNMDSIQLNTKNQTQNNERKQKNLNRSVMEYSSRLQVSLPKMQNKLKQKPKANCISFKEGKMKVMNIS